ncbi:MAG: PD-(D/E)XK nuclease family protein [Elusimicrobia bacterium]|nr:PD-(D/E)XK nuclease family protein [Elusimicrobiota bacterium]
MEKVKSIKRPRGIFPSLPGGMDRVIKIYMDGFRSKNALPQELAKGNFDGIGLFPDQAKLDKWRNWRTGLRYEDRESGSVLSGALDDLLVKDGRYIPFDYKTKGSPTTEEAATLYYQNQIDCYALLLKENSLPPADFAFLLYYSPKTVMENGQVHFEIQPIRLSVDPERARITFRAAIALLNQSEPSANHGCEYCSWFLKKT